MRITLLGPMAVEDGAGSPIEVHGRRLRALLARLALDAGQTVPVEVLIDDLWGAELPSGAVNALQSLISRLRKVVPAEVASLPGGYRLAKVELDATVFEQQVATGRQRLHSGEYAEAARLLGAAERLWQGHALADLTGVPFAGTTATRLEELRRQATEDRFEAELALGHHAEVLGELEPYAVAHPLRENVQAKLMRALAGVGRQADALATYDRVRQALADELGMDPSPELATAQLAVLRGERTDSTRREAPLPAVPEALGPETPSSGFPDHEPAAHWQRSTPTTVVAPERSLERRGNLRAQLTSFVGRENDLARIGALLSDARLITLVGPGGAGKTRLAVQVAGELARTDDHAVDTWFVGLASVTDPHDLVQAVASTLGLRESRLFQRGPMDALATYRDAMSLLVEAFTRRATLLVLDNCEHLVGPAAELAEGLVAACPDLRIVTTSREPLNVPGEVLYTVPPLAWPSDTDGYAASGAPSDNGVLAASGAPSEFSAGAARSANGAASNGANDTEAHHPTTDPTQKALAYPAVRLFVERAATSRSGFELTTANLAAVVEVCRRLDGMPLAIELAAAKVRALPLAEIAHRLDDRFRLLTNGNRTALPRHQTLRAVIEWSWDLLSEPERTLARRLAIFPSGATLDAAEQLVADTNWRADVVEVLSGLVDKSLVEARMSSNAGGQVRYRMLETVRAYGVKRLDEAGESHTMRATHAAYFQQLAETADGALRTAEQLVWIARLRADYDNVVAAIRWAIDTGDADTAVRMCASLSWFWTLEGNRGDSTALSGEALALPHASAPEHLAGLYLLRAGGLFVSGRLREAMRSTARGLRYSRRPGATERSSLLRLVAPANALFRERLEDADRLLVEAAEYLCPWGQALGRLLRSHVLDAAGDIDASDAELVAAIAGFAELGERWGHAIALRNLAGTYARRGDHASALDACEGALALVVALGSSDDLPEMYATIGINRLHLGQLDEARANLEEAFALFERDGRRDPDGLWFGHLGLAELHRRTGDFDAARGQLAQVEEAVLQDSPLGQDQRRGLLSEARGWLAVAEAEPRTAEAAFRAMLTVNQRDNHQGYPNATLGLAAVALLDGDPELAAYRVGIAVRLRGTLDRSNPDVDTLVADTKERLGEEAYAEAYERGHELFRDDARAAAGVAGPLPG